MTSQIGIVIWGCKGGYRMFCSNGVVRTDEPSIAQTVKDIRPFVRVSRVGVDYYALEFTNQYKVYTLYRSSFDSGSGAFTAITVYVPHHLQLRKIRTMLVEMMDAYFRENMNPLTYAPIPGKYDDINPFVMILNTYADQICTETGRFRRSMSVQDDTPQIVLYDEVAEVDAYFEQPYHPEFFACQEVMFFSREIFENQSEYQMTFGVKPRVIEQVSPPETLPQLSPFHVPGHQLTRFVCNGRDLTATDGATTLNDTDVIDFTVISLQYGEFFEPFTTGRVMVKNALANGWLVSDGKNYRFADRYQFVSKSVLLPVKNDCEEVGIKPLVSLLTLTDGTQSYGLSVSGGQVGFILPGEVFFKDTTVNLKLNETAVNAIPLSRVKPVEQRNGLHVNVIKRTYSFNPLSNHPGQITVQGAFGKMNVKLSSSDVALYLPAAMAEMPVQFSHPEFKCDVVNGMLSFTPTKERVDIDLGGLEQHIGVNAPISYRLSNQEYLAKYDQVAKRYFLLLPVERDKEKRGNFFINKQEFRYQLNENGSIGVLATLLINDSGKAVEVCINHRANTKLKKGGILIYPSEQQVQMLTRNMSVDDDSVESTRHPLITVKRITDKRGVGGQKRPDPPSKRSVSPPFPPFWKSKNFLVAAPLILILLGVGVWFLFFRSSEHTLTMEFKTEKNAISSVKLLQADDLQPQLSEESAVKYEFSNKTKIADKIEDIRSLNIIGVKVTFADNSDSTYLLSNLLGKERMTQWYDFYKSDNNKTKDVLWEVLVPAPQKQVQETIVAETKADQAKRNELNTQEELERARSGVGVYPPVDDINDKKDVNQEITNFQQQLLKLNDVNCTLNDAKAIRKAWNNLSDHAKKSVDPQNIMSKKIKAYEKFLSGQKPDPNTETGLFSPVQYEWCKNTIDQSYGWTNYTKWCNHNNKKKPNSFVSLRAYYISKTNSQTTKVQEDEDEIP